MKNGFIIYKDFYEPVKPLSDLDLGILFRSIFEYQIDGTEPGADSPIKMAFMFFKNQFDLDAKKYLKRCELNTKNGRKGGRPKTETNRTVANKAETETETETEKETETKTGKDKETVVYPFHTETFLQAWKLWKQFKKDQFRYTHRSIMAENTALNKLAKLANGDENTALLILEQSVSNGWRGLFALKGQDQPKPGAVDQDYLQELQKRLS